MSVKKVKIAPTLLIGLGGTGCEIVSLVDKLANEAQREYIRCVFFDTDANELRERKEEAPHTFTVQTSKSMTVGQALRTDREARENSFPTSSQLLKKPLTEGAGQVRAVSKLAFDACVREGRLKPLHDAINELQYLDGDTLEQSMRVVIVTTLVGGTGSGILLPVSMYLRNYLENICQTKPLVRGICVLPDVFFHGTNKPESEKNNLRTNAYAALRELDAFMQKAENPSAYPKFSLLMPVPGTLDDYEEYAENPMDFCFLYDGLNIDGNSLQNFEAYKRHIAECIFASSVSILNKRLNSSEDNTILSRCGEGGRNRYCGIGSSKMIYPFEQVRDYIAMGWMSQAMTEDWLSYDKEYEKQMMQRQASQKRGIKIPPLDKKNVYCELVNSGNDQNNPFASAIYMQCHSVDSDGNVGAPKWQSYYRKLLEYITDKVENDVGYDEGAIKTIDTQLKALKSAKDDSTMKNAFSKLSAALKKYFSKTKQRAESRASILADSLFAFDNFNTGLDYHIEHWLLDGDSFIHPNAVRYFLYNLEMMFDTSLDRLMTAGKYTSVLPSADGSHAKKESFATIESTVKTFFEEKRFIPYVKDDKKENGDIEQVTIDKYVQSLDRMKAIDFDGGMKKNDWENAVEDVAKQCDEQYSRISAYYKSYLEVAILRKALECIRKILSNYEHFYRQLDTEIKRLPRRMENITQSFNNNIGDPKMFVCASQKCIEGLSNNCPNTVDSITLTLEFRNALFESTYKLDDLDNVEKNMSTINDFVEKAILNFWRGQVVEQYGKKVDMDIIDALRTQAELEEGKFDSKEQTYYIKAKYEEAMKLAAPFIDNPIGEEHYKIYGYALGKEVAETDDILKASVIKEIFPEHEVDPLMDKYQMLFMNAIYNLRICHLPKFAPEDTLWVDPRDEGTYFRAYWRRINNVIPDDKRTKTLTPHLDKRWHYAGVMPDLSEKSEEMCLRDAHRALLISIAYGRVDYDRDRYRFKDENGDYLSANIVVGDGKCNRFSEIYEAMLMSRPLVREQLDHFETKVIKENDSADFCKIDHKSTKLYQNLGKAKIKISSDIELENISFLELPILYKATAGGKRRSDDECIAMLRNMIDLVDEYLAVFFSDELDRTPYFVEWMREQALLMCTNLSNNYSKLLAKPFEDPLVKRIKLVLETKIEACSMNCPSGDDSVSRFMADFAAAYPKATK